MRTTRSPTKARKPVGRRTGDQHLHSGGKEARLTLNIMASLHKAQHIRPSGQLVDAGEAQSVAKIRCQRVARIMPVKLGLRKRLQVGLLDKDLDPAPVVAPVKGRR